MGWLNIALGVVCFGIGAACVIGAIGLLVFDAAFAAAWTGLFGALFLFSTFLLFRGVRWHENW